MVEEFRRQKKLLEVAIYPNPPEIEYKVSLKNMQYLNFAKKNYKWPNNLGFTPLKVKLCFTYGFLLLKKKKEKKQVFTGINLSQLL